MRAQHADDLLHRFDSRTHRLPTPVIEKLAGPSWGIVVPHPHWNPQESGLRNTGPNCDYLRRRERPRDVGMVWRDSKSWGGFAHRVYPKHCLRFQHFVFWRGIPSGEVITPLQIGLKGMK